jgi:hypothetical protein
VLDGERVVAESSAHQQRATGSTWIWTITGAVIAPRLPSHGYGSRELPGAHCWDQLKTPRCDLARAAAFLLRR